LRHRASRRESSIEHSLKNRLNDRKPQQRADREQPAKRGGDERKSPAGTDAPERVVALALDCRGQSMRQIRRRHLGGEIVPKFAFAVDRADRGVALAQLGERRLHECLKWTARHVGERSSSGVGADDRFFRTMTSLARATSAVR
jgi:hypothetical protein